MVRAAALQAAGHWFESSCAHQDNSTADDEVTGMNLLANPNRRDFLRRSLGLGAGAGLVALGLGGCSRGLPDGGTEEIAVADVPVGGGVIVGWYVITQPVAGEFKAFHANCPHANVKVTGVDQTGVL